MKHLKYFEKLKVGDFVRHVSYNYVNGNTVKNVSKEIYKISDRYNDDYEISDLNGDTIDWVGKDDIVKVSKIEKDSIKYNL